MILTCPACATQYTVKDGAIPPGGRQVRCASCKHSWHQDGDAPSAADQERQETAIAPPPPHPIEEQAPFAEVPDDAAAEGLIAGEPQPEVDHASPEPAPGLDDYAPPAEALEAP
nr:zinc-ribbon domain-containing protein [Pseudomonadota bacterium]